MTDPQSNPQPDARPGPSSPPPLPHPPPRGGPLRALWQLAQPVLAVLLLLALIGAALGGAAVWLLRSPEGTAWLLARVPGLDVTRPQGALLSDRFAAERLVVRWSAGKAWVAIDGLAGSGLQWAWHPSRGAWVGLQAERLQARRVEVQTGPSSPGPAALPSTLLMPLRLQATQVQVDELVIDTLPPMRAVQAGQVSLWERRGRAYAAETLVLDWEQAHIEGRASLLGLPPFTLAAEARARTRDGAAGMPWTAELRADGPLAGFALQARLRGTTLVGKGAAPALDAEATITPLESWPLGKLRLRTQALDLASLHGQAPRTALGGHVDIDSQAFGGPLGARIELDNAQPGRWDEGWLPLRRLQARVRSPDADRRRLLVEDFELLLARAAEPAGRWHGTAQWQGERLQVDSAIEGLRPQLLDARAAAMTLTGPLDFVLHGLPSPDPQAPPPAEGKAPPLRVEVRGTLEGRIDGTPHAVKLALHGKADAQHIELQELRAEAGPARALLALNAQRAANGAWQLRSNGTLADFDPVPWWRGDNAAAWRSGSHRLSGGWTLDLALPRPQPGAALLALLPTLAGSGSVHLERSQLAGVPLNLNLELAQQPGRSPAPSSLQGELNLGGNRLRAQGEGNPLGDGQADRLQLTLQADNLATLAPLARLLPDLAPWTPRGGRVQAELSAAGRWPALRSEGKASLQQLQLATLQAQEAQADWRFDTGSEQPLRLQVDARGLAQGEQRVDQLTLAMSGTWRQHRLELSAALPGGPPVALANGVGLRTAAGSQLQMRADGQWLGDSSGGGRWNGQLAQLTLGPWAGAGRPALTGAGTLWLDARDLRAQARVDPQDGLVELQAEAGRLRLAEAATLRWDEVRVDLRGANPAFALRADIEPFELAPLLARTQPDMGWSGDLRLAARVDLRVADKVDADVVFERRDGDLRLVEENTTLPLGLNQLRAVLSAHDGQWQMSAGLAGQAMGEASARLNLRTRPEQRWPTADTPIDGVIDARVPNLGIWSTWVPPGWRLGGQLRTRATVVGRVGEPDYSGEISAQNVSVRNLLLGVDVREGDALIKLQGAEATIERFVLRGGEGTVRISGSSRLAGKADTRLQLQAERFRVLGRIDRQITASGNLQLAGNPEAFRLDGKLHVDEGLFELGGSDAPSLDDDVQIRHAGLADKPEVPPPPRVQRNQVLAVEIDLGDKLRVRGRGIDTRLSGSLRLTSGNGRPLLTGTVSGTGGTYQAYGQKLDIERGLVIFSGELSNPNLDILAIRPNLDTQVGVAIIGPLVNPRVRLYSSTDMSDSDKLSWLLLGRASDGLGRSDAALLQRAAVALLAGEGEGPTDALLRNLGLDELSVRQSDTDVRETVITLGKQLSRRWYVGYERGVNATSGTWQLIYRIAQRFTLRAQSGYENSLDLIWVWRLGEAPPAAAASSAPTPAAAAPMPKSAASAPP